MKVIQDILFPLNIKGVNRDYKLYDVRNAPLDRVVRTIAIQWTGECLQALYTERGAPVGQLPRNISYKKVFSGGGTETFTVQDNRSYRVYNNTIYFNCINVTSLIVNGEQLI